MHSVEREKVAKSDTNFLRVVAIFLIINSHLDAYYPIPYLGTGGAMGNSLFFVLSSFGLFLSERKQPRPFIEWYTQRIKRIYPTVWIVLIILTLPYKLYMNAFDIKNILVFCGNFFYPPFWFLQVLMIYYCLMFFIVKHYRVRKVYYWLFSLSVLYAFVYLNYLDLSEWTVEDDPFQYIFYLMIFMFGAFLADRNDTIRYSGILDWGVLCLTVFIIYTHKFLMLKGIASSFQFIQQFFMFPFIYYCFKVSRSGLIQKDIMSLPTIAAMINYVSNLTLELFLVHLYVIILFANVKIAFPINIILVLIVTFILAGVVKVLSKLLLLSARRYLEK